MSKMELVHLGYVVSDMKGALKRFRKEGARVIIEPTIDPIQNVVVCLLEIDGLVKLELVAPIDAENNPIQSRLKRGGGLDHVCYLVESLDQILAEEEAKGALVVRPPAYAEAFHRDIAFVQRRSGLVVEFMTHKETKPAY